jgi:hypothetical protein
MGDPDNEQLDRESVARNLRNAARSYNYPAKDSNRENLANTLGEAIDAAKEAGVPVAETVESARVDARKREDKLKGNSGL